MSERRRNHDTLARIIRDLEGDHGVRVLIITGAGEKAFAAGADVKEVKEAGKGRKARLQESSEFSRRSEPRPKR